MGVKVSVHFVKHAAPNCVNPNFPSIHISTEAKHTGWVQVIKTDQHGPYAHFIDTVEGSKFFPFYSFEQDFFDAPLWSYGFILKPISYWVAHAYAVEINKEKKTLSVKGGIRWGFRLKSFSMYSETIPPQSLAFIDWKSDWNFI